MDGLLDVSVELILIAVSAAWSSLLLFAVVWLATLAGRRWLSARVRWALWTLVLVRLVLPFSWATPFGWGGLPRTFEAAPVVGVHRVETALVMEMPAVDNVVQNVPILTEPEEETWLDFVLKLGVIAVPATSMLLAAWMTVMSIRLSYRVRRQPQSTDATWNELLAEGCHKFRILVPVRLCQLAAWNTPATLGFIRPVILLPEDAGTLSPTEMRHVLWHELSHIKRGDAAWNYLLMVVRCLQWWNPCFWLVQYAWLTERELACDALVVRNLDTSPIDYGKTLLHFLERVSTTTSARRIPIQGLVLFLGEKAAVMRRLKALAHPITKETTWGRWCSATLLLLLASMGLTDAAPKPEERQTGPIDVSPETRWEVSSAETTVSTHADLPVTTEAYDIRRALDRVREDEPEANGQHWICDLIQGYSGIFPWSNNQPPLGHCTLMGDELIVTANSAQHQKILKTIAHWERFGQRQITVEVRMLRTLVEPTKIRPQAGGKIVSPAVMDEFQEDISENSKHTVSDFISTPAYICKLTETEVRFANQVLVGDRRASHLYAPTVTLFSGGVCRLTEGGERPCVTGLKTLENGSRERQYSFVEKGVRFHFGATLVDAASKIIELKLHLRESEVVDVELLKAKIAGEANETTIEIPHVRTTSLKTSVNLFDCETFLFAPLRRDKAEQFHIYMITPRLIF